MSKAYRTTIYRIAMALIGTMILTAVSASAQNYSLRGEGYTAQRKPRVAVLEFGDTNTDATSTRYGPSVSAMLVTFLKTKSQFVVVERQNINSVLDEWKKNQNGLTNLNLDQSLSEILERLDVILMGSVTVLGNDVEVDAKLLSRADGRIITATERSGPISCLRQVVDRVGVAIEQGFLKPYYGSLRISLDAPANTRLFLTPILSDHALDEEKPPIELGFTIKPGEDQDQIRSWTTNPNSFTINNILSGWYSLRLERPGYEGRGINNALFEIRGGRGKTRVCHLPDKKSISAKDAMEPMRTEMQEWERYLVYVAPLRPNEIDASSRALQLRKKSGAVKFSVVDENQQPIPGARVSLVSRDLEINPKSPDEFAEIDGQRAQAVGGSDDSTAPASPVLARNIQDEALEPSLLETRQVYLRPTLKWYLSGTDETVDIAVVTPGGNRLADRAVIAPAWSEAPVDADREIPRGQTVESCEFLIEDKISYLDHGRRLVQAKGTFDLPSFEGGLLAFEDYQGEHLPEGSFEAFVWAPYYRLKSVRIHVDDGKEPLSVKVSLERRRQSLLLTGRSENLISFFGTTTGYEKRASLGTAAGGARVDLPVDLYRVDTDVLGFRSWRDGLNLLPPNEVPPSLEDLLPTNAAKGLSGEENPEVRELRIKNRVWVAGRVGRFRRHPGVFYDARTNELLDSILGDPENYSWDFALEDVQDDQLLMLEERLRDVDLLILNEDDMSFLRVLPELREIVRRFVENGRALLAFVTWEGDYAPVLGAPLSVRKKAARSAKLKLRQGEVRAFETDVKIDLGSPRILPRARYKKQSASDWRILSFTKKGRRPRVVERGSLESGGYVMVWFESAALRTDPGDFESQGGILSALARVGTFLAGRKTKKVLSENADPQKVAALEAEETGKRRRKQLARDLLVNISSLIKAREANQDILLVKSMLKNRALLWAEYLMYRELDDQTHLGEARRRLESAGAQ